MRTKSFKFQRNAVMTTPRAAALAGDGPPRLKHALLQGTLVLYTATIFLSATLLFAVQPMFAKMVLPLLGGSPSVWNTAMVFFQAALLAGYGYVHLTTRRFGVLRQSLYHMAVLILAFAFLPIAVASGWTPEPGDPPGPWLIGLLVVSIGLPFFAVSATGPMLQLWFANTGHRRAADPYFLYAASNLGSITALLAYPTLIEPSLPVAAQNWLWSTGFAALALLIGLCALSMVWGASAPAPVAAAAHAPGAAAPAVGWAQRLRWLALAFAPSALLLGVTAHLTTDVAAVPFLWVVPLALYLLTFVLVFARRPPLRHETALTLQVAILIPLVLTFAWRLPIWPDFVLHLGGFFFTALVCHGELARRRPGLNHLTEFYFWMSLGGVLGGIFTAILAPALFDAVVEYPLLMIAALLLRPRLDDRGALDRRRDRLLYLGLLLLVAGEAAVWREIAAPQVTSLALALFCAPAVFVMLIAQTRPLRFAGAAAVSLIASWSAVDAEKTLYSARSFFGVHRITLSDDGRLKVLVNGTTAHGAQYRDPAMWREPLSYYHRGGPVGEVFAGLRGTRAPDRVGVVGLGAGTIACYRRPEADWTFYEIDPAIVQIARDEGLFSYLRACAPEADVVLGDARLSLQQAPGGAFDVLVIDAFSSDGIPVHLMTREALALYADKLAPGGLILFHVSNRALDLAPVVGDLVADAGLVARLSRGGAPDPRGRHYGHPAEWIAIARKADALGFLGPDWEPLAGRPGRRPWTDDFSNVFGAIRW